MANYCVLTGAQLPEGSNTLLQKMCINCTSANQNEDGTYSCTNEEVMEKGRAKIMAAIPEGYEIETLVLKPMLLKAPTKKCNNYVADIEFLTEYITANLK